VNEGIASSGTPAGSAPQGGEAIPFFISRTVFLPGGDGKRGKWAGNGFDPGLCAARDKSPAAPGKKTDKVKFA
jgi:hypothetical protein